MLLVNINLYGNNALSHLYLSFINDLTIDSSIYFLPFNILLQSEFQDTTTIIILVTPELTAIFNDYIYKYILPKNFDAFMTTVFDSYMSNTNLIIDNSALYFIFFGLFA
jgi:hypothetical protein